VTTHNHPEPVPRPETSAGADLTPIHQAALSGEGSLLERVSSLIEQTRAAVATQANAALTLMHWHIGRMIDTEILCETRADYAKEIVASLEPQLTRRFGRGFTRANLYRMIQFSQVFSDEEIVVSLSRQLSWSHILALLPVRSPEARAYYIDQAVSARLSVRALRELIGRHGYERKEIANAQALGGSMIPADSFRDPYFLEFLGLHDSWAERDLEVGNGWAFVSRQQRMTVDNDDFYLDLLFFSRPLRRLIAVELKIGKFKPSYKGQMDFYLKWLDRYERQPGEEAPIGLILCTEASREQVELLEMHKDGIVVAEYWTTLPPKEKLETRIQEIYRDARERIARHQITPATEDRDD